MPQKKRRNYGNNSKTYVRYLSGDSDFRLRQIFISERSIWNLNIKSAKEKKKKIHVKSAVQSEQLLHGGAGLKLQERARA